jgi:hypothetical protein
VYRSSLLNGKKRLFLALAASGCTTACGSSTSSSVAGPTADRCSLSLSAQPTSLQAAGGRGLVSISTNRECAWEAQIDADWIQLESPPRGQGTGTLGYHVAANPVISPRRARSS